MRDAISCDKMKQLIEDAGYEYRSYSGRGMFGKSCVGVVLDEGVRPFKFIADLVGATFNDVTINFESAVEDGTKSLADNMNDAEEAVTNAVETMGEELSATLERAAWDSMGMGTVVYFPDVAWVESEGDGDDVAIEG